MAKNTNIQVVENLTDNFRGYAALLRKIKQRVQIAQQRAIYAVNEEMLRMYWDIGGMLQQSQDTDGWGKKTLQRLSVDLKNDYSEIKGFSVRNMQCMIQFFNEYNFTLPIKHLLTFTEQYNERDVEIGLVNHVERYGIHARIYRQVELLLFCGR